MSENKIKKKIVSNVYWSVAEKILTDLVDAVISIVLARLLLPSDYGLISLVQIFITVSSIFVLNGLDSALIQNKNADEEQTATIMYLNIFVGLFIYLILFLMAPLLADYRGNNELTSIIRVLAIKVPIASVYNIQHAYIKKRMEFKRFFFSSLAGTLVAGLVGIVMAYKGFGVWSLVASTLIDQIMDSVVLFITTKWFPKFQFNLKRSKEMIVFGSRVLFSQLFSSVYSQLRPLVIAIKYSTADLAYNSKANKFSYSIINITNAAIMKVMFPVLSSLQDDKDEMYSVTYRATQVSMFFLAPLMIGMAVTAKTFVPLFLTKNWIGCVPYIWVYCFIYLFAPISSMNQRIVEACGRSDITLKENVFGTVLDISSIVLSIVLFKEPLYMIICMSIASTISLIINMVVCQKVTGYKVRKQIQSVSSSLLISTCMGIVVYLVSSINIGALNKMVVEIGIGCLTYVVMSLLFKTEPTMYIINSFKKKINHE